MASGDVLVSISADNTAVTLQPSLGVGVLITYVGAVGATTGATGYLTDGSDISRTPAGTAVGNDAGNVKIFIDNSTYLTVPAQGAGSFGSYSGVEL